MFQKRTLHFGRGITVPAIQIGEAEQTTVTLADGRRRPAFFAEVISLRETNPNGPNPGQHYPQLGIENLRFTTPRYDEVEGLDYEVDAETGEKVMLTAETLVARVSKSLSAWQASRVAATPQVVSLDGDED